MRQPGMHCGNVDTSPTLKCILGLLMSRGLEGATTLEIAQVSGSMAPSTDVSAIRKQGYNIKADPEGKNENGRKVYRYRLIQPAHVEGLLF